MAKRQTKKAAAKPLLDWIAEALRPMAVPLTEISLDPENARLHDDDNLAAICGSLDRYGQLKPIVVNRRNNQIVAGNGTYQAAAMLGWSHLAVVFEDLTPEAQRGFSLADNQTALLARWDRALLRSQVGELIAGDDADMVELLQLARYCDSGETAEEGPEAEDGQGKHGGTEGTENEENEGNEEKEQDAGIETVSDQYSVVVACADEADQKAVYELHVAEGRKCRLLTL